MNKEEYKVFYNELKKVAHKSIDEFTINKIEKKIIKSDCPLLREGHFIYPDYAVDNLFVCLSDNPTSHFLIGDDYTKNILHLEYYTKVDLIKYIRNFYYFFAEKLIPDESIFCDLTDEEKLDEVLRFECDFGINFDEKMSIDECLKEGFTKDNNYYLPQGRMGVECISQCTKKCIGKNSKHCIIGNY